MVRECVVNDLNQMIELAFQRNNEPSHFSAFCPCRYAQIQTEFVNGLNSKDNIYVGYFENNVLKGMLGCYTDSERKSADCCGPFVDGDFISISKKMFEYLKSLVNSSKEYTDQLIRLHDTIFPDVYISGRGIIQSIGIDRQVFCAIEHSKLIGYSVLKTYKDSPRATAEIISVDENYRHQGYGRALLNKLLETATNNPSIETIDLIVEKVNENALSLYYSMGFELFAENCCYIAK